MCDPKNKLARKPALTFYFTASTQSTLSSRELTILLKDTDSPASLHYP
jgi:hypothetical protein